MTIEELYSEYRAQSGAAASASHSDHDDHSDSGYSDFGNHEDWGENIHVDYNSGSGYKENFTINLTADVENFARVIVQDGLESNWQGGDIKIVDASGKMHFQISCADCKIYDSIGSVIFNGGGTIILQADGVYEINSDDEYDGENYGEDNFNDEDYVGEDFDDNEDYDDENFSSSIFNFQTGEIATQIIVKGDAVLQGNEVFDASGKFLFRIDSDAGKVFDSTGNVILSGGGTIILQADGDFEVYEGEILADGAEYYSEDYYDEDYDEGFNADFAINFLDGARVRIIFQGKFESRLQGDDMKIFDSYGELLFQIDTASRKIFDADGEIIFQLAGTVILRDDGEFQTYAGQFLYADENSEENHEDYYTDEHEDNHRHSDYDDHDDSSSHDDYDDDYDDHIDYDDYDDTYSDWS